MTIGMRKVQDQIDKWQMEQFPNATLKGAAEHLDRERAEATEELADCFFLATQCERLGGMPVCLPEVCWAAIQALGHSPEQVILDKLAKNKSRSWPEKPDVQGVYEAQDDDENEAENQG